MQTGNELDVPSFALGTAQTRHSHCLREKGHARVHHVPVWFGMGWLVMGLVAGRLSTNGLFGNPTIGLFGQVKEPYQMGLRIAAVAIKL